MSDETPPNTVRRAVRDRNGKFLPGGPGNPNSPRPVASWLRAVREAVTPDDMVEVAKKAMADAKAGDAQARAWLGKYLIPEYLLERNSEDDENPEGVTINVLRDDGTITTTTVPASGLDD